MSQPGSGADDEGPANPDPVTCVWVPFPAAPSLADKFNDVQAGVWDLTITIDLGYYSYDGALHRYNLGTGQFERRERRSCTDPNHPEHGQLRWLVVAPPNPAILLPIATRIATERIELPEPDVSPAGDVAVNLGMWLAVEPAGPYTARAAFNDAVWAETTATLVSTSFDPDDGSAPVTCDGHGTPIPDLGTRRAGPCGHVYDDRTDIGHRTMTITSTWRITWRLSNGASGQLADIVTSATHEFDVFEVQTVGVSG